MALRPQGRIEPFSSWLCCVGLQGMDSLSDPIEAGQKSMEALGVDESRLVDRLIYRGFVVPGGGTPRHHQTVTNPLRPVLRRRGPVSAGNRLGTGPRPGAASA